MKYLAFTVSILLAASCATKGTGQEPIGEGQWEVRVWDGELCKGKKPKDSCQEELMPVLREHSLKVCAGEPKSIAECTESNAPTGKRLKCHVTCK